MARTKPDLFLTRAGKVYSFPCPPILLLLLSVSLGLAQTPPYVKNPITTNSPSGMSNVVSGIAQIIAVAQRVAGTNASKLQEFLQPLDADLTPLANGVTGIVLGAGNGGGYSALTVGSGLNLNAGTLTATSGAGLTTTNGASTNALGFLKTDGTDLAYSFNGGSLTNLFTVDVQVFTNTAGNPYTWTKPVGCIAVYVEMIGGGGEGGSGRHLDAAAEISNKFGGGGGAGGSQNSMWISAHLLADTEQVTVGVGGTTGGAARATDANGEAGQAGTLSSFGANASYIEAAGGGGGGGGTASAAAGGTASSVTGKRMPAGGGGGGTAAAGGNGTASTGGAAGAGGGGGGITATTDATASGGSAAALQVPRYVAAISGGASGASGTSGASVTAGIIAGGQGGSGGASKATGSAGSGGAGGNYGGGGGGGGASVGSGYASGAGGSGANGIVVVISYIAKPSTGFP